MIMFIIKHQHQGDVTMAKRIGTFALLAVGFIAGEPVYADANKKEVVLPAHEAKKQIPMSTALQDLKMNGYTIISKIELDKDFFAVDALSPQGHKISVLMKSDTGEIKEPKKNPMPQVSLEDAVKRAEGSGYHDIYRVEYSGHKYLVKGYDQKDKKVKLKIDGDTGEITTSWF
jgi:hypothetical protein